MFLDVYRIHERILLAGAPITLHDDGHRLGMAFKRWLFNMFFNHGKL